MSSTSLSLVLVASTLLGCSATTLTRHDGTVVRGDIGTSEEGHHVLLDEYGGRTEVEPHEVAEVQHPGSIRMGVGGAVFTAGALGQSLLGAILASGDQEPYVDPVTGREEFDDDYGCELCVLGLPITMTNLTFGTALLFHGVALRRESIRQMDFAPGPVGTAHMRIGGSLLGVGVGLLASLPLLLGEPRAEAAGFTLVGFSPGFALTGIALMIRGARLKRGRHPVVDFTADGFTFDFSL